LTAPVTLGTAPIQVTVTLPRGADFVCELVAEQDWPDGAGVELKFHTSVDAAATATWAATIDGTAAIWDVPAATVEDVIEAEAFVVRLHYVEPDGTILLWGRGRARAV
jgi:hypothetical protein